MPISALSNLELSSRRHCRVRCSRSRLFLREVSLSRKTCPVGHIFYDVFFGFYSAWLRAACHLSAWQASRARAVGGVGSTRSRGRWHIFRDKEKKGKTYTYPLPNLYIQQVVILFACLCMTT